ncbi:MAG TPA: hypothetical protein VGA78_13945 [Gemmatimonadales bacterium]|jgi:hypothetical protein
MPVSRLRDERGMALVMAVLALVVMGALVAGSFFVSRVEQVSGYNTVWATEASESAEAGIAWAMSNLEADDYGALPVYEPGAPGEIEFTGTVQNMAGRVWTDSIRRLNNELFLVRSTGQRLAGGNRVMATHTVAQLVRLVRPTFSVNAAITVQDPIQFNGNALDVSGYNAKPEGWAEADCPVGYPAPGNSDDLVGIRSSGETGASGADLKHVAGFPTKQVTYDPTVTSATFQNFLDFTFNNLTSQPNVKTLDLVTPYNGVQPVLDGAGACDKTQPLNFGEPWRGVGSVAACQTFYPTVHGTGAETQFAAGNRGQGILLVEGDLVLVGGFEWAGLILVRGQMKITGTGNKITGAVLTEGVNIDEAGTIGGNAEINYSRCAIENAMNGAAVPAPVSRGWSQIY